MSVGNPHQPSLPPPAPQPDWTSIRAKAKRFPPAAFDFIRDGLAHTVQKLSDGKETVAQEPIVPETEALIASPARAQSGTGRHITGQQLCAGIREMARERYGMLTLTVLHRWGIRTTEDFGVIVYALIDRGEMRCSNRDRFEDFIDQYDFATAFATDAAVG